MGFSLECAINYEYEDGKYADASATWDSDHPTALRIEWKEPDGYCSMEPECKLNENSSEDDVLSEIENYGDVSDVTVYEYSE
jgi:hypothetical protein